MTRSACGARVSESAWRGRRSQPKHTISVESRTASSMLRRLVRATASVGAAAAIAQPVAAAARAEPLAQAADTDARARLRRQSTTPQRYQTGQQVRIVCVPQIVAGVNVGHISLLVTNHDGSEASVGYYAEDYRRGLRVLTSATGVLVTPDPLYARAKEDEALRAQIYELHRGALSASQAARLNDATDDAAMSLSRFTTSAGAARELGVTRLEGERYSGSAGAAAAVFGSATSSGAAVQNCATWLERLFPDSISCPMGIPRLCTSVSRGRG